MPVPVYKPSGILAGVDSSIDRRKRRLVNEGLGLENIDRRVKLEEYIANKSVRDAQSAAAKSAAQVQDIQNQGMLKNPQLIQDAQRAALQKQIDEAIVAHQERNKDSVFREMAVWENEQDVLKSIQEQRVLEQQGIPPRFDYNNYIDRNTGRVVPDWQQVRQRDQSKLIWDLETSRKAAVENAKQGTASSAKQKTMMDLINLNVDPFVAEGIAFGTYQIVSDPNTGNINVVDLRQLGRPLNPNEAAGLPNVPKDNKNSKNPGGVVQNLFKGKKSEIEINEARKNISEALTGSGDLGGVDAMLAEIEKLVDSVGPKGDIPGFGLTGSVPHNTLSEKGKTIRIAVNKLFNMMLKLRSGAAVTESELLRLADEFGKSNSVFSPRSDKDLRRGLSLARKHMDRVLGNIAAAYAPYLDNWDEHAKQVGGTLLKGRLNKLDKEIVSTRTHPETGVTYGMTKDGLIYNMDTKEFIEKVDPITGETIEGGE